MSQNSARLAVGIAFLTCAAGFAFCFLGADSAKVHSASVDKQPKGETYPVVAVPSLPERTLGWERATRAEDDLWVYDLFTPVEVKWNASTSAYEPKGLPVEAPRPFGLRLAKIGHPHYRYRLAGLYEAPEPKNTTIVFNDEGARDPVRGKTGETVGPAGGKITILSYENKAVKKPDGSVTKDTYVLVKDLTLGKELQVRREVTQFKDRVEIAFAPEEGTGTVWQAAAVGDKFENDAGSYVIKGIDFEDQTVTVEKTWTTTIPKPATKTETKTLNVSAPTPAPAPAPKAKK